MTETVTALELFEQGLSKSAIKQMASKAVESVLESGNVLQVAEALSAMQEFVDTVKKDERFKDYVRDEAGKYPKGFIASSGAKIETCEVGTRYDFSKCNDPEHAALTATIDFTTEKLKTRESFLKTIPLEGMDIITGDGEVVKIFPPSKTSTSSFKVTLSK